MLSIIFLEQSSIYETEHALALGYLKKVANNKFTRRRKYYQSSSQFIQCLIYLYLWKNIYLTECVPKSIQLDNNFVPLHFISFSRLFNTLFVRVKKSSVLYKKGRKSYYNSCYKRGATKNDRSVSGQEFRLYLAVANCLSYIEIFHYFFHL